MMWASKKSQLRIIYKKFTGFVRCHAFLFALAQVGQIGLQQCRKTIWLLRRPQLVKHYIRTQQIKKLQIGTYGNYLENWLNTDLYPKSNRCIFLDATKSFPFDDKTFNYIFSEHMIEHLPYNKGAFMLRECFRVLRPGGKIRIATPNLEALISLCMPQKSDLQQRYMKWFFKKFLPDINVPRASFVINHCFRAWGHQFLYVFCGSWFHRH